MHHSVPSHEVCLDVFGMKVDRDHSWDQTVITLSRGVFLLLMVSGWCEHNCSLALTSPH